MFLFELRAITARDDSTHSELYPVFVFFRFLFRRSSDRLLIARATVNPCSGKGSRKNQHQESARGVHHSIQINISAAASRWTRVVLHGSQRTNRSPAAENSSDRHLQ